MKCRDVSICCIYSAALKNVRIFFLTDVDVDKFNKARKIDSSLMFDKGLLRQTDCHEAFL